MPLREQAIQKMLDQFSSAWEAHDAGALALLFTEDADFTNVFGKSFHGRAAIAAQHAPLFVGMFKSSKLIFKENSIRFLEENLAAVDAYWDMSGATDPQGNAWPGRRGLMNLVLKNEDGWHILIMHNMDVQVQR